MNTPISVVIICRNEAHIIGKTIDAALRCADDVVVVDSGSTDGTQKIVTESGARLLETNWEGYGKNKNKGVTIAKHDWILSIDADEIPDEKLIKTLQQFEPGSENEVYDIRFRAFLIDKMIRFGEWSGESHIRLYNRIQVQWNEAQVHEILLIPKDAKTLQLPGYIHHYTARDLNDFRTKSIHYAELNAIKYYERGKRAGLLSCYFSTIFSFLKNFIFRLGFLDGSAGFTVAKMNAWYTWLKYKKLRELNQNKI